MIVLMALHATCRAAPYIISSITYTYIIYNGIGLHIYLFFSLVCCFYINFIPPTDPTLVIYLQLMIPPIL